VAALHYRRATGACGRQHPGPLPIGERLREDLPVAEAARLHQTVRVVGHAVDLACAAHQDAGGAAQGVRREPDRSACGASAHEELSVGVIAVAVCVGETPRPAVTTCGKRRNDRPPLNARQFIVYWNSIET
jgi:hypothetical protein